MFTNPHITMTTPATIDALHSAMGDDSTRQRALDQCMVDRATELVHARETAAAEAILTDLLSHPAPLPAAMDLKARLLVRQGRFLEAEQLWTHVLEAEPNHATARNAIARLHVLQRRAFWFARPSARLVVTVAACALATLPFWLLARHFSKSGHATRDALTSLATTHQRALTNLAATHHIQQQESAEVRHAEALRRVETLAASVDPLSILAKSSAERGAALANAQQQAAAAIARLTETAAALEVRQNQVAATLDVLRKATAATAQTLEQSRKANTESLAALPNLVSDELDRREENRRAATSLPVPAFQHDGVTVSGDRSRQHIVFKEDLFSADGQLTPESTALLTSLASSLASIPHHPPIEIVAICPRGTPTEERAALVTRLTVVATALSSANPALSDLPLRVETVSGVGETRRASSYKLTIESR